MRAKRVVMSNHVVTKARLFWVRGPSGCATRAQRPEGRGDPQEVGRMRAKNLALTTRPARKGRLFWGEWPPIGMPWRGAYDLAAEMRRRLEE